MTNSELSQILLDYCEKFSAQAASRDKKILRELNRPARQYVLERNKKFLEKYAGKLINFIASGSDLDPLLLNPILVPVKTAEESRIFRFATLSWSVPVSVGYGRKMRFLVFDGYNDKLIGVLGLCDPVFNLSCRDVWIGWDVRQKENRLSTVMNAYVLGAVPPYSFLLGGKLVALLALSNEVRSEYRARYSHKKTLIKEREHTGDLALITVTSALGKSSIYNRIKAYGTTYYYRIGETLGWGHHHLTFNGLYEQIREYLIEAKDPLLSRYHYGEGPNWKFRLIRQALKLMGLPEDLLRHGIKREVYGAPLGQNSLEYLRGETDVLKEYDRPASELTEIFRKRWLLGRAKRNTAWLEFKREGYLKLIDWRTFEPKQEI